MPTSPSQDGAAVTGVFHPTDVNGALAGLSTAVSGDLIICTYTYDQNAPLPSATAPTSANLTFTLRKRSASSGTDPRVAVETWQARATGTLSSEVITGHITGADAWCFSAVAFQNANASPFDPNASLPAITSGTGATSISGVSSTNLDDLLLGFWAFNNQPAPSIPSGWTSVAAFTSFLGGGFSTQLIASLSVSAAQSGLTITTGSAGNYATIIDALTSDGAAEVDIPASNHTLGLTEAVTLTGGTPASQILNLSLVNTDVILRLALTAAGPNDVALYGPSFLLGLSAAFKLSGTSEADIPPTTMALGISEATTVPDVNTVNLPSSHALGIGETVSVSGGTVRIPVVLVVIT